MSIIIVLSGFLAIVALGSALVAVNDLLERWWAQHAQTQIGTAAQRPRRTSLARRYAPRDAPPRASGRRHAPRGVVVVHTDRFRSADA